MIVLRADLDKLNDATSVLEVFAAFGLGKGEEIEFTDEKVFGKKANYANMFCTDLTYRDIYEKLGKDEKRKVTSRSGTKWSPEAVNWCWFSPISSGQRFEKFEKLLGDKLMDYRIYILTPDDKMYEEAPDE